MLHAIYLPATQAIHTFFGTSVAPIGEGCRTVFEDLKDLDDELRRCGLTRGSQRPVDGVYPIDMLPAN